MDQEAVVTNIEGDYAHVEIHAGGGCGHCHETDGCANVLGKLFDNKPRSYRLINHIGAAPGDHVLVHIAEGMALRAVLLVYVLPLVFLLVGALLGVAFAGEASQDALAVVGALLGFAVGVLAGLTLRRAGISTVAEPVLARMSSTGCLSRNACP